MNFNILLDKTALYIALVIELIVMTITMLTISPGLLEAIAMIAIGFIIVFFAVRSWMKGGAWYNKFLWAIFALISFIFNWNFALVSTQTQTINTQNVIPIEQQIEDDFLIKLYKDDLISLQQQFDGYTERREDIERRYNGAARRTTVDAIIEERKTNEALLIDTMSRISETRTKIATRTEEITVKNINQDNNQTQRVKISSQGLFYAVPNAINEKRWAELIIFFLIFLGLEITIIVSATDKKNDGTVKRRRVVYKKPQIIEEKPEEIIQQESKAEITESKPKTEITMSGFEVIVPKQEKKSEIIVPKVVKPQEDHKSTEEQIVDLSNKVGRVHSAESEILSLLQQQKKVLKGPPVKTIIEK